jgi:hypothetical protein
VGSFGAYKYGNYLQRWYQHGAMHTPCALMWTVRCVRMKELMNSLPSAGQVKQLLPGLPGLVYISIGVHVRHCNLRDLTLLQLVARTSWIGFVIQSQKIYGVIQCRFH